MKNRKTWRIVIIVLLVCSAILAFGPCLRVVTIDFKSLLEENNNSNIELEPFFNPIFFSIISFIEICLVFNTNKAPRVIGILLQLFKNVAIHIYRVNAHKIFVFDTIVAQSYDSYILTVLSYVLFFLGLVITVLYFIDLFTKVKPFNPSDYLDDPETEKTQQNP